MNNFINTINVEGVNYDIQTSVNPPLKYLGDNSLRLNIGTGLTVDQGDLIADVTHKFNQFYSIIIDPKYWSIDDQGYLLPSSYSSLKVGTGLNLDANVLSFAGIPISTDHGTNIRYIEKLILGTGLEVSGNTIDITVPISTNAGSTIMYMESLNIGQGLKYDNGELIVDSIATGGILIATEHGDSLSAYRATMLKISDAFVFNANDNFLGLNLGSEFNIDDSKKNNIKLR